MATPFIANFSNSNFLVKNGCANDLIVPTIVVASVVFGIVLHSLLAGVLIFLITLIFLMLTNILGILINLWVPKLNWENEVQVVKQSLSVLLSMVFNFVLAVVPVVIYLIFEIDIKLVAMITLGLYVVCLITFAVLLFTKGKKRFYKLNQ